MEDNLCPRCKTKDTKITNYSDGEVVCSRSGRRGNIQCPVIEGYSRNIITGCAPRFGVVREGADASQKHGKGCKDCFLHKVN